MGIDPDITFASRPAGIDDGIYPFLISIGFSAGNLDAMECLSGVVTGITQEDNNLLMNKVTVDIDGTEYEEVPVYMYTDYGHARRVIKGEKADSPLEYTERSAMQFIGDKRGVTYPNDSYNPQVQVLCEVDEDGGIVKAVGVTGILDYGFVPKLGDSYSTFTPFVVLSVAVNTRDEAFKKVVLCDASTGTTALIPNLDKTALITADFAETEYEYYEYLGDNIRGLASLSWTQYTTSSSNNYTNPGGIADTAGCIPSGSTKNYGYVDGTIFYCADVWTQDVDITEPNYSEYLFTDNLWGGSSKGSTTRTTTQCDGTHTDTDLIIVESTSDNKNTSQSGISSRIETWAVTDTNYSRADIVTNITVDTGSTNTTTDFTDFDCPASTGTVNETFEYNSTFSISSGTDIYKKETTLTQDILRDYAPAVPYPVYLSIGGGGETINDVELFNLIWTTKLNFICSGQFISKGAWIQTLKHKYYMCKDEYVPIRDVLCDDTEYFVDAFMPSNLQIEFDECSYFKPPSLGAFISSKAISIIDSILAGLVFDGDNVVKFEDISVSFSTLAVPFDLKAAHLY